MIMARTVFVLFVLVAIALAFYILRGSAIVSDLATAGDHEPGHELNASEEALEKLGIVADKRLTEISGIDASIENSKAYWVHNDSGHPADVYLIAETGQTLMRVSLKGCRNIDWEDISVFKIAGKPVVCVADVGDNAGKRKNCQLYLFDEPKLEPDKTNTPIDRFIEKENVTTLEFTYEDGPRNCEAIAYDARGRSIFLFQKAKNKNEREKSFGIYELRIRPKKRTLIGNTAKRIAEGNNPLVTAADIHERSLMTCNYAFGTFSQKPLALRWANCLMSAESKSIALPVQRQREAICFTDDGKSVIVVSEYGNQPIWKIALDQNTESK